jgi:hypothetical protein
MVGGEGMQPFARNVGKMVHWIDAGLLVMSPLAILMVIVAVIVLLDRAGEHAQFLNAMHTHGRVVDGQVSGVEREDALIFVRYIDGGQEETGLLYTKYYPEALNMLNEGQALRIRFDPHDVDRNLVWEDHFSAVENYWGYAVDSGLMLLIGWLIVVIHPEFLYIGYAEIQPKAVSGRDA